MWSVRILHRSLRVTLLPTKDPPAHSILRYGSSEVKEDIAKVRNIGILAHIDAGKTTTTERMLYYAGRINAMGEVHHGNTVTDYLEQERNRGITITSAAVTFSWNSHRINLVDTPGHIDFTTEVEQSLTVVDGGVVVLDSSAGVEAQTVTVWRQARSNKVPCIIFANKMDRPDANLKLCLQSVSQKFNIITLPLQIPVVEDGILSGIIDIIELKELKFGGEQGITIYEKALSSVDGPKWESAKTARTNLTSSLADVDDDIADLVIGSESLDDISADSLVKAVRRATIKNSVVPVLCGSAYKNIGVQKLMDSVVQFLPSPVDRPDFDIHHQFGKHLYARVFKIIHDKMKGPITFLRIFSGKLEKGQRIYNLREESAEVINRVMIAYADDFEEVDCVYVGNVAAVTGLKGTKSGDYVTSSHGQAKHTSDAISQTRNISKEEAYKLLGGDVVLLDPVFFCTIEPPSLAYQKDFEIALENLKREDPGLRVNTDPDTGQTILGGMGELHLEIIKDRIRSDYKIEADVGPLQIAYKEAVISSASETHSSSVKIGKFANNVTITMSIAPSTSEDQDILKLDRSNENASHMASINPRHVKAVQQGIQSSLFHGPKVGCPVMNATFTLHQLEAHRATPESVVTSAASQCVQKLLQAAGSQIMEPVMSIEVVTSSNMMPKVMADLSKRNAKIHNVGSRSEDMVVEATVPLAQLLGYSRALRTTTSGQAAFTMQFHSFQPVSPVHEGEAIKNITGFYP